MDETKGESDTYDYPANPVFAMSYNSQNVDRTKPELPVPEKSIPVKSNGRKCATVALILVLGINFLLALCGVLIGTFAYIQLAVPSQEEALPSSQSTPIKDMSSEVLKLQESFTSVSKMIEAVNGTMYVQLHLLDEKILETHIAIQNANATGTPGIYAI